MADTGTLPDGKLDQIRVVCEAPARPFEYAFLLDALRDEQAQGITIDAAPVFFTSRCRRYVVHDAPGHVEFLNNMITGAASADAALLVIDAHEGIRENSRRHGYLLSLPGAVHRRRCWRQGRRGGGSLDGALLFAALIGQCVGRG